MVNADSTSIVVGPCLAVSDTFHIVTVVSWLVKKERKIKSAVCGMR